MSSPRPELGKLLRLREWLTVAEAARHISILFEEDVTEADVLRLALDGHLTLSVDFVNHAHARCGPVVPLADASRFEFPLSADDLKSFGMPNADVGWFTGINGISLGEGRVFEPTEDVVAIEGIWDLTMLGAERLDVEHEYQRLTGGPSVELICLEGPILSRPDGIYCQVQAHFDGNEFFKPENLHKLWNDPRNFYPAGSLPKDAVYVVRTNAVRDLARRLSDSADPIEKPLERRERATLLVLIGALAELAKVDIAKPSSAAAAIESQTALMGARVASRTIENHLKRIPEALENRTTG